MKLIIQRVKSASVVIENLEKRSIGKGLLVYLGVHSEDTEKDVEFLVNKLINLRCFEDDNKKMNLSIIDLDLEILIISNFSIYGDFKKGNRPSFTFSAKHELANKLYCKFIDKLIDNNIKFKTGEFKTEMDVYSINDGPINLIIDTKN